MMLFSPALHPATLLRRYKRFLADVRLQDGSEITLHCANTGAMTGCAEPGSTIYFSTSDNPKRKYPHTWELTHTAQGHWICVNTARANQLIADAISADGISELDGYAELRREVRYGTENSRIDLLLQHSSVHPDAYIEVKSVTLLQGWEGAATGQGYFPDAVSTRGQKHLRELINMAQAGKRAVLMFAVLHSGIECVAPARHIDPRYADLLQQACALGVEVLAYRFEIAPDEISKPHPLAVKL